MLKLNKKQVAFIGLFVVLGIVSLQIKLSNLAGSQVSFTGFDFFSPGAGAFLGPVVGAVAVFLMQLFNFFIHGAKSSDIGTYIRFLPPLFAAIYFAKKTKFNILVPIVAIIAFNLNPTGRSVWYFSFYWLIPVICYFWQDRSLLARSLGATFTAHAVGGAIWIYAFALPKAVWVGLIPVVAMERLLFAAGIAATYVVMTNLVNILVEKKVLSDSLKIDQKYVWNAKT